MPSGETDTKASKNPKYRPNSERLLRFQQSGEDIQLAHSFRAIALLLQEAEKDGLSDKIQLLISTCRNSYLTLNAMFTDISLIVAGDEDGLLIDRLSDALHSRNFRAAQKVLHTWNSRLSQYDAKRKVWNERDDLSTELSTIVGRLPSLDADSIKDVLHNVKSVDPKTEKSFDPSFYAFDLQGKPWLEDRFRKLDETYDSLKVIADFYKKLMDLFPSAPGTFFEGKIDLQMLNDFALEIEKHFPSFEGEDRYERGRAAEWTHDDVQVSSPPSPSARLEDIVRRFTKVTAGEVDRIFDDLTTCFPMNLAHRPMPDPFIIDLTQRGKHDNSERKRNKPFRLSIERNEEDIRLPPRFKVALLRAPLADSAYDTNLQITDGTLTIKLRAILEESMREASRAEASVLLYPEYWLPHSLLDRAMELSRSYGLLFISGLEASWLHQRRLANRICIYQPSTDKLSYQFKLAPSIYEYHRDLFYTDGRILLFENTAIGTFATIACSDFIQPVILSALEEARPPIDHLFVVCRNPAHDLFSNFAIADAYRLYCNVLVVNHFQKTESPTELSTAGAGMCSPLKGVPKWAIGPEVQLKNEIYAGHSCSISVHEVSMNGPRGKYRGKSQDGFMVPPWSRSAPFITS